MKGGVEPITTSYILFFLPIETSETPFVVVSIKAIDLWIPIIPKLVPLAILMIGIGAKVTMINIALHAFEVLYDFGGNVERHTYYWETNTSSTLVKFVDVLGEKHVDELVASVE